MIKSVFLLKKTTHLTINSKISAPIKSNFPEAIPVWKTN